MKKPVPVRPIEPRWTAALTILAVLGLLTLLPDRVRFFPVWVPFSGRSAFAVPLAIAGRSNNYTF